MDPLSKYVRDLQAAQEGFRDPVNTMGAALSGQVDASQRPPEALWRDPEVLADEGTLRVNPRNQVPNTALWGVTSMLPGPGGQRGQSAQAITRKGAGRQIRKDAKDPGWRQKVEGATPEKVAGPSAPALWPGGRPEGKGFMYAPERKQQDTLAGQAAKGDQKSIEMLLHDVQGALNRIARRFSSRMPSGESRTGGRWRGREGAEVEPQVSQRELVQEGEASMLKHLPNYVEERGGFMKNMFPQVNRDVARYSGAAKRATSKTGYEASKGSTEDLVWKEVNKFEKRWGHKPSAEFVRLKLRKAGTDIPREEIQAVLNPELKGKRAVKGLSTDTQVTSRRGGEEETASVLEYLRSGEQDPAQAFEAKTEATGGSGSRRDLMLKALDQLTPEQKSILETAADGTPIRAAASALGIPKSVYARRLKEAREAAAKLVPKETPPAGPAKPISGGSSDLWLHPNLKDLLQRAPRGGRSDAPPSEPGVWMSPDVREQVRGAGPRPVGAAANPNDTPLNDEQRALFRQLNDYIAGAGGGSVQSHGRDLTNYFDMPDKVRGIQQHLGTAPLEPFRFRTFTRRDDDYSPKPGALDYMYDPPRPHQGAPYNASGFSGFMRNLGATFKRPSARPIGGGSGYDEADQSYIQKWGKDYEAGETNLPAPKRDLRLTDPRTQEIHRDIDRGRRDMIGGKRIVGEHDIDISGDPRFPHESFEYYANKHSDISRNHPPYGIGHKAEWDEHTARREAAYRDLRAHNDLTTLRNATRETRPDGPRWERDKPDTRPISERGLLEVIVGDEIRRFIGGQHKSKWGGNVGAREADLSPEQQAELTPRSERTPEENALIRGLYQQPPGERIRGGSDARGFSPLTTQFQNATLLDKLKQRLAGLELLIQQSKREAGDPNRAFPERRAQSLGAAAPGDFVPGGDEPGFHGFGPEWPYGASRKLTHSMGDAGGSNQSANWPEGYTIDDLPKAWKQKKNVYPTIGMVPGFKTTKRGVQNQADYVSREEGGSDQTEKNRIFAERLKKMRAAPGWFNRTPTDQRNIVADILRRAYEGVDPN